MIALDTHALVWWLAEPARIPAKTRRLIRDAVDGGEKLTVSSISIWEVAMLVDRGRLELRIPVDAWIRAAESVPFLSFVPVDNDIAIRAVRLHGFEHRDPADRIIVATAIGLGATLVSADRRLRGYSALATAWD